MKNSNLQSAGGKATALILRKKAIENYYESPNVCKSCGEIINVKDNEKVSIARNKRFCNRKCSARFNNSMFPKRKKEERLVNKKDPIIPELTKDELFLRAKSYHNARSIICKDARASYMKSSSPYECLYCGYNIHCDIAHKVSVSKFPGNSKIREINDINNLIPLCKNHHWEFDNGFLSMEEILKTKR